MKAWIANCVAHHAECRDSPASARLYPTRLIDVGTKASPELRLRVSTEDAIDGPYATLSHCWGGLVPFRLLKDNMKDLRKRIEFQQLPKTFQDAITTARGIGVRYLWIDSLCIIQDSTDDWAAEAPQMTLVYGGSLVTFAATAAEDGTQGLFLDKSPPAIPYVKTSWTDAPNFTYGILRELLTRQHIDEGALNRRAWVFQERILSRRLIHFAGEQIFWQCYGRIACESLPSGLPEVYQRPSLTRRLILDPSDSGAQGGSTLLRSSAQPLRIWADMVREYSAKKLTYPGDRLMAISGIARLIQKTIKDEYMAGMWRRNLARELCWDSSAPVAQQRSLGRGPSWSWASLDGPIRFRYTAEYYEDDEKHSFPRKPVIEILHASVTLKGQDAYGQVESGSLHVRGSVYPVRPGSIGPSDYDLPGSDFNSWRCEDVGFETPYCAVDWDTGEDETLFTCGTTLYWLPVWFDAPRNPVFPNNVYLGGLLLRGPVPDGDGSFRRAGSFDVASIGVEAINVFLDPEFYSEWKRELVIS
ncbi:heterokaryon incompatibility protein-domain-containing protein [Xylariaceae sp. FL0804]|nr:heterokaryon incompatibility protein-domain-containing protein [Xylariaceae sp. FL0804]